MLKKRSGILELQKFDHTVIWNTCTLIPWLKYGKLHQIPQTKLGRYIRKCAHLSREEEGAQGPRVLKPSPFNFL